MGRFEVCTKERDAIRNKYSNCLSTCTNMIQQDLTDITLDPQPNYNAGLKGDSIIYHCTNASQGVDVPGHAKREVECSIRSEVLRSTCSLLTDWPAAAPMVGTIMPQYGPNPKSGSSVAQWTLSKAH
uniref:Uncharacterized protein n=1 Tax=Gopherus agassizii TaxID=38772 RepID=A0A452IAS6_9SAUR